MINARDKARAAVKRALGRGQIARPTECEYCGKSGQTKDGRSFIHAHHYLGYGYPLEVIWLCPTCHFKEDPRPCRCKNGRAMLTEGAIAEIRNSKRNTKVLAAKFGVHRTTIQRARAGISWIDAALGEK